MCGCVCVHSTVCKGGLNSHLSHFTCHVLQEAHVFISAEKVEDVTEEKIRAELGKAQVNTPAQWVRRSSRSADKEELVVSVLQYFMCPSDGDRDFRIHIVTQFNVEAYFLCDLSVLLLHLYALFGSVRTCGTTLTIPLFL